MTGCNLGSSGEVSIDQWLIRIVNCGFFYHYYLRQLATKMANVKSLTTMDYVSLVVLSVLSCLLGLYHMLTTKRYNVREFLMKNPKLNVLSLILSIAASDLSGASFLGLPREVYMNGVIFATKNITQLFVIPIGMYVFLPLIFKLGYSSMFQVRFFYNLALLTRAMHCIIGIEMQFVIHYEIFVIVMALFVMEIL